MIQSVKSGAKMSAGVHCFVGNNENKAVEQSADQTGLKKFTGILILYKSDVGSIWLWN